MNGLCLLDKPNNLGSGRELCLSGFLLIESGGLIRFLAMMFHMLALQVEMLEHMIINNCRNEEEFEFSGRRYDIFLE